MPITNFGGCCQEALAFYRKTLGTEVTMMMRSKESPDRAMKARAQGQFALATNSGVHTTHPISQTPHTISWPALSHTRSISIKG